MSYRRLLLAITALAFLAPPATAWNHTGHMVAAQIAYRGLSNKAKAEVERLLAIDAEPQSATFVTAGCWPDDLKGYGIRAYDEWHYTNRPLLTPGTPSPTLSQCPDVVWAINQCTRVLRSKQAPDAEKARMLRFLIHFVGDVHQPLHCVSRYTLVNGKLVGDRGGNDFTIVGVSSDNLHSYWDSGLGFLPNVKRPLSASGAKKIKKLADDVMQAFPKSSVPEWAKPGVTAWVEEGVHVAKNVCYKGITNTAPPSAAYKQAGRKAVKQRLALAGYRLANVLNAIYR
ncbi:MAG TPA: S1/P1 nuclease [Chthonomonadales bacterium]|nr:S1/P1 nuclease [Chthonomonadales bacterium]